MYKHILLALCMAGTCVQASAQTVLERSAYESMLSYGLDSYPALNPAGQRFSVGTPGSDTNVFHFDRFAFEAVPAATIEYQIPGSYPFDTLFPGATHVIVANAGGTFNYYNYMQFTDSAMLYMGDASGDENGLFSSMVYDPPFPVYAFPLAVGKSLHFSGNRHNHLGHPGRIETEYTVESAGTLVTQHGSETVLLLRRVVIYTDSLDMSGNPNVTHQKWARLELVSLNGASSYINVDTSTVYDAEPLIQSLTYNTVRSPSGVDPLPPAEPELGIHSMYPNPLQSAGQATVEWSAAVQGNVQIAVYNAVGRKVEELYTGHVLKGKQQIAFEYSALEPGLYFLVIRTPTSMAAAPMFVAQ